MTDNDLEFLHFLQKEPIQFMCNWAGIAVSYGHDSSIDKLAPLRVSKIFSIDELNEAKFLLKDARDALQHAQDERSSSEERHVAPCAEAHRGKLFAITCTNIPRRARNE